MIQPNRLIFIKEALKGYWAQGNTKLSGQGSNEPLNQQKKNKIMYNICIKFCFDPLKKTIEPPYRRFFKIKLNKLEYESPNIKIKNLLILNFKKN